MHKAYLLFSALIVAIIQPIQAQTNDPVLLSVEKEDEKHSVQLSEFAYLYKKNYENEKGAYTKESLEEYLVLFINFKRKVWEAKAQGLDDNESFQKEFEGYRKQLAKPYLTDRKFTEELISTTYERLKQEVNVSHLLIALPPEPTEVDTAKAWAKVQDLRTRIMNGEDFNSLARQFSEDPSARFNGGSLGYFTALQMVYPFEEAAYITPVGDISEPVRTQFGYHLLKVHNRRPSRGYAKAAHIMVRATAGISSEDSIAAINKINQIHSDLREGVGWDQLCREFSDDANSKEKGGELPWFTVGNMPAPMVEAVFSLQDSGDISEPVQSVYGWHIMKLLGKKPLESYAEMKSELQQKVAKDSRSAITRNAFLEKLKSEYRFEENTQEKEMALAQLDSSLLQGKWQIPDLSEEALGSPIFHIDGKPFSIAQFFDFVKGRQRLRREISLDALGKAFYQQFVEQELINYEDSQLANKYDDFRHLEREYFEGMLFFEIMEKEVWQPSMADSTGLQAFFNENQKNYKRGERVYAVIFNAQDQGALGLLEQWEKSGEYHLPINEDSVFKTADFREVEKFANQTKPLALKIEEGWFEKGKKTILEQVPWQEGIHQKEYDGRVYKVVISKQEPVGFHPLKDIKGQVIADYQAAIEEEWLKTLAEKYPVDVEKKVLFSLTKKP